MRRVVLLAALIAPLFANHAHSAQALAFSGSASCSRSYAVVTNAANREEAKRRALAECRDVSGRNDCKIILENESRGYGALYAAIANDRECYVSALTGYASRNAAHDATLADCKKYYGVASCTPLNDWRETGPGSAPTLVRAESPATVAKPAPTPTRSPATPAISEKPSNAPVANAPAPAPPLAPANAVAKSSPAATASPPEPTHIERPASGNEKVDSSCNDAKECVRLGDAYSEGKEVRKDMQKAIQYYETACNKNNSYACAALGIIYKNGDGVQKDTQRAGVFFVKACFEDQRNGGACHLLGDMYQFGTGVPKDFEKAAHLHELACDLGSGEGCIRTGLFFRNGNGVKKDLQRSQKFFERGCELRNGRACDLAGIAYDNGDGVRKNKKSATEFYKKGCDLDFGNSCAHLAAIYLDEEPPGRISSHITVLYRKSCDLNSGYGCYFMGIRNEEVGYHKDAETFFKKSCELNFELSCKKLKDRRSAK